MLPQAGQQHMPNYPPSAAYPPQNVAYPPAVYGGRPAGRGTPYGARPGFANMAPGYQPQGSQYPPQQQQGAYGQGPPPAHALGPVHGPQRPPNMSPDMAAGSLQDPRDNRPEQNERHRPQQNGMSASDLQAQQERKRRFTEKSAKNGWKQVLQSQCAAVAIAECVAGVAYSRAFHFHHSCRMCQAKPARALQTSKHLDSVTLWCIVVC